MDIDRLASCYWFTVEFGLVKQEGQLKAYGAGLVLQLSAFMHACMHACSQAARSMWLVACVVKCAVYGMWNVACSMRVECDVQYAVRGMWNVACGSWRLECGIWSEVCSVQRLACRVQCVARGMWLMHSHTCNRSVAVRYDNTQ